MNAQQLFKVDGQALDKWFCGKCGHIGVNREHAEQCCHPGKCETCGAEIPTYWRQCRACFEKADFEKAEMLESWDGWVTYGSDFHASVDEFMDMHRLNEDDRPEWVEACDEKPFPGVSFEDCTERLPDQSHEEILDQLEGVAELKAALAAFNKANEMNVSYRPNGKYVWVPWPKEEDVKEEL